MFETVPDSPWNTSTIDPANSLTWSGESAANRGWKPSNTAVRSIAGVVWSGGMTAPGGSGLPPGAPGSMARKRWPSRFSKWMAASVVVVSRCELSTLNETSARPCCRLTPLTLPTSTPAIRTVSPACSSDALVNCATYPVVASVFTSSNVEITIDVVTRDTTVKATSLTTVSRSPGRR